MQKRLAELGYPVGSADGVFGDNTFVCIEPVPRVTWAIRDARVCGTPSARERLYAKSACPPIDAFRGLKKNDSGIRVLILRTYLYINGYNPGELDSVYGANTKAAVERFQFASGIPVTGEADKTTLILLYGQSGPTYPLPTTPTATPTMIPVTVPPVIAARYLL